MASSEFRCPLCESLISRAIYERVLRIDQARKHEAEKRAAALKRELEAVEKRRLEITRRAAEAERKRLGREAAKQQATFQRQIAAMEEAAAAARRKAQRELDEKVRAARKETEGGLRHVIRQLQADIRSRTEAQRRMAAEIARTRKEAEAQRKRADAEVAAKVRDASERAQQPLQTKIATLTDQLATVEQRRARDEENYKRLVQALQEKLASRDQAHFGPEGEEQLVSALKAAFPGDQVERRGRGGDVLHTVFDGGKPVAKIIYEVKNTSTWQVAFTRQLKKAMEQHETRYGILVSRALPKGKSGLCIINKTVVVAPGLAQTMAGIMRESAIAISRARLSDRAKAGRMAELLDYLRSDSFANAVSRIDDKIKELRDSLMKERAAHDTWWRGRDQHYATIIREASGIDSRVREILSGSGVVQLHRAHG